MDRPARSDSAGREAAADSARRGAGLSAKLLFLTILFVMIAEVLVFVPSVSNFRRQWLNDRLAAAQIAALAAAAAPNGSLMPTLRHELLMNAQVMSVSVRDANGQRRVLNMGKPRGIDAEYDLRGANWPELIMDALAVYTAPDGRVIRVIGEPGMAGDETIDVVMGEAPLKTAVLRYSLDILGLSILISIITGSLVYLALDALLVRPMTRLTGNIVAFRQEPEDPRRIIEPTRRKDEIGRAERALAAMERELATTLSQKRRLAALGLGVSKVSHDLRNMLSSAQLLSDRLAAVDDPTVQRLVPKLLASLERAIRFCDRTLDYGHAQEAPPARQHLPLHPLASEVAEGLGLPKQDIAWHLDMEPDMEVDADPDHLFRILTNLTSNAVQALETAGIEQGEIRLTAWRDGGTAHIEISDTGPGLSERARAHLFEAFQSVARKNGTGLGLAITAELVKAHGGSIELVDNATGATFHIALPERRAPAAFGPALREAENL